MNDYTEAWQPAVEALAEKNNRLFQEKQIEAIKQLAAGYGIDIISATIDPVEGVILDFENDFFVFHHTEFLYQVEMIMETQNVNELAAAVTAIKKEKEDV